MKKLLSSLLLAVALLASLFAPADAALSYQYSGQKYGNNELFTAAVTSTANDTTTPFYTKVIDNRDGRIQSLSVLANVTASTGTSPTVQLTLEGSNDGSNFATVYSADATPVAIQTTAQSISSAVVYGFDTAQELRAAGGFPAFLRVKGAIGGSSSPGWTGTLQVAVKRASL